MGRYDKDGDSVKDRRLSKDLTKKVSLCIIICVKILLRKGEDMVLIHESM